MNESFKEQEGPLKKTMSEEGTNGGLLDYVYNMLWRNTKEFGICRLSY